jgi:hypothetical protein
MPPQAKGVCAGCGGETYFNKPDPNFPGLTQPGFTCDHCDLPQAQCDPAVTGCPD